MPAHDNVTPYDKNEDKKSQVTSMFNKIAPYYDFLNRLLSMGVDVIWRKNAIKCLDKRAKVILDVASGTGDLAIEMAQQLNPERIIGSDISQNMLDIGIKKVKKKGLDKVISFEHGDSENLPYADGEFDVVTASFGVRNFENLSAGLSEMCRVLKPGGQLMILEFSKPTMFPLKQGFNTYFKYVLPVIGRIQSKDPKAYQYLYESVQAFPDYEAFGKILEEVGFKDVNWKPQTFGICTIYLATK